MKCFNYECQLNSENALPLEGNCTIGLNIKTCPKHRKSSWQDEVMETIKKFEKEKMQSMKENRAYFTNEAIAEAVMTIDELKQKLIDSWSK